jgi:hypothetical protein
MPQIKAATARPISFFFKIELGVVLALSGDLVLFFIFRLSFQNYFGAN